MDASELFVVLGGLALIVFTLWFFFGAGKPKASPTPAADGDYACPMHPWIVSKVPGATCSLCGMQLVRKD